MGANLHKLLTSLTDYNTTILSLGKLNRFMVSSRTGKLYLNLLILRFSSCLGSSNQLIDLFATDLVFKKNPRITAIVFIPATGTTLILNNQPESGHSVPLESTALVFKANDWLEREVSEMFGSVFSNKKDSRNLLLEYTNVFKPMLKSFPSVGLFELFFDTLHQNITHKHISLQL